MKRFSSHFLLAVTGIAVAGAALCGNVTAQSAKPPDAAMAAADKVPAIIPRPAVLRLTGDACIISIKTPVVAARATRPTAVLLARKLMSRLGGEITIVDTNAGTTPSIELELRSIPGKPDGYQLQIAKQGVRLISATDAGLFYAAQSLLQTIDTRIAESGVASSYTLPALEITDEPRFAWRGLMLDEARHFFGKVTVMKLIDTMAYLKMNRLHWHLTDDRWRYEIKAYPRLTSVGSIGQLSAPDAPALFYTQEDIREIVRYAADRHIMIIPEIEMPGHARGATIAYPELMGGTRGNWKYFTYNPASEQVRHFLETVITETAALFPAPYLHIGGDECNYGWSTWQERPEIPALMKQHNLKDNAAVENFFMRQMSEAVLKTGKKVMGWEEIANTGLDPKNMAVVWWHSSAGRLQELIAKGYEVILCQESPTYFSRIQANGLHYGRGPVTPVEEVYRYPDPLVSKVPDLDKAAGLQAALWTETVHTPERLWFQLFPRLTALAEASWTPAARKDYTDFTHRLPVHFTYLRSQGINYYNPLNPASTPEVYGPPRIFQPEWGGWAGKQVPPGQ